MSQGLSIFSNWNKKLKKMLICDFKKPFYHNTVRNMKNILQKQQKQNFCSSKPKQQKISSMMKKIGLQPCESKKKKNNNNINNEEMVCTKFNC